MKRFGYAAMAFLCVGVSLYAALAYALLPLGAYLHPEMRANFLAHPWGIYIHVFAAMAALIVGPLQFSSRLRAGRPKLHRMLGRFYLGVGVGVGGASGLYMAQLAFGGVATRLAFTLLAIAWLYTGWRAYAAIRVRDVPTHREWMVRNFALTLAAVTLRIELPLLVISGLAFETAYVVVAWLCWAPNLVAAELWLARARRERRRGSSWPARAGSSAGIEEQVEAGDRLRRARFAHVHANSLRVPSRVEHREVRVELTAVHRASCNRDR